MADELRSWNHNIWFGIIESDYDEWEEEEEEFSLIAVKNRNKGMRIQKKNP